LIHFYKRTVVAAAEYRSPLQKRGAADVFKRS